MSLTYSIGSTGIVVPTQAQLLAYYQTAYLTVYGTNLALQDPSSPDNQFVGILMQANLDAGDLIVSTNAMMDPDQAIGVILDQRCAINGIQRQVGTYTTTNITLVTSQSLNLGGLDGTVTPQYVVSDNAGNNYNLIASVTGLSTGTHVLPFQAANPGALIPVPNTITTPVTIVLGVTSINNPTTYIAVGVNEESDTQLKTRRQASVALPSQGILDGLYASLVNVPGVTFAYVEENVTSSTNADNVPGHSIWAIVAGSGAAAAIANAIYTHRSGGCGMYGSSSYTLTQADGAPFTVYWDVVVPMPYYIRFQVSSLDGITPPNILGIQAKLGSLFTPGVAQTVNINELTTVINEIDPNSLVTNAGFSFYGFGYTPTLSPPAKNRQFYLYNNLVIFPMIINGTNVNVSVVGGIGGNTVSTLATTRTSTTNLSAIGGLLPLTYSFTTNATGGTINASTGVYVAGSTAGTDVVKVTDSDIPPNTSTITITVT
jgi:uncharacterized phage protein gp47/JayE